MFKEKRLIYMTGPEGPGTADVIKNIETKTAVDKTAAAALKDEKVMWSESADKPEGAVNKFLKGVENNAAEAIPNPLLKTTAKPKFREYFGGTATKGLGGKLAGKLKTLWITEEKKARKKAIDEAAKKDPPVAAKDVAPVKLTPKQEAQVARAAGLAPTKPEALVDITSKASYNRDAFLDACKSFDIKWKEAEANMKAAEKIEAYKEKLLADMKRIAVTAVHEKQQFEFNMSRVKFISSKVNDLIPAPKLAKGQKELTPEQMQKLTEGRQLAARYLEGMLSGAELKVGKEAIAAELKAEYENIPVDVQRKFITSVQVPVKKKEGKTYDSDVLTNASPEVRARVEGLLDSITATPKRALLLKAIQRRINSLPKGERNNPIAVDFVLSTIHQELGTDKKWKIPEINDEDKKEKIPGISNAMKVMKKNPYVAIFFKGRMAKANELFKGQPDHVANMRKYRSALFSAIGRQDPENVNVSALQAIPLPSTFDAGASIYKDYLSNLEPATRMLPGTGAYALKLMKRLKQQDAPIGTIIKFKYKTATYYGEYTGNNLVIYTKKTRSQINRTPGSLA